MSKLNSNQFGLVVVAENEFPAGTYNDRSPRKVQVASSAVLHTSQDKVDAELVEKKRQEILAGAEPQVTILRSRGKNWLADGHHTLVAARQEGCAVTGFEYKPSMVGAHIAAPRFVSHREVK